jgi:hypothetical protein
VTDRRLDVPLRLKPSRRTGLKLADQLWAHSRELASEHVGEQPVEAEGLAVSVDGYQEQVGALDLGEHGGGTVPLEHRIAGRAGHLIEDR